MKKFALTPQGLRFKPGTEDFIYLTFWLNVCVATVTSERGMKKIAKGGTGIPVSHKALRIRKLHVHVN